MYRLASKMQLIKGFEAEYKKRHDEIWPELQELLRSKGIDNYHIFLDEETGTLFATLQTAFPERLNELPAHPVMQKWWLYMKDIMETNDDHSPVSKPLKQVFCL